VKAINLEHLLYIPLIFLFLPAFAVPIGGTVYYCYYLVLYVFLLFLLIKDNKKFINKIIDVIKKTPFKIFVLVLFLMTINMFFLLILGKLSLGRFLISFIFTICLKILPIFLYFIYVIDTYIPYRSFVKGFILIFWINLLVGFVAYIGQLFNIEIITNIFDFFANARILSWEQNGLSMVSGVSDYAAFGLPRLDNLCQEPSEYAHFLCIFLPLVFAFGTAKIKIFKNKYFNFCVKLTLVPFTIFSVILTLSPIALVLCCLLAVIYFRREIIVITKKYFLIIALFLFLFFILINKVDFSKTYLSRILNVVTQIHSLEDFILIEPSLATRIISYINIFCIFCAHPFTGVGMGNLPQAMSLQLQKSPVPLTPELITRNTYIAEGNNAIYVNDYLYAFLAENGFFSFILLAYFYYKLYKFTANALVYFKNNKNSFNYALIHSLQEILISLFIIALYNMTASTTINPMYFVWALIIALIYRYKTGKGEI